MSEENKGMKIADLAREKAKADILAKLLGDPMIPHEARGLLELGFGTAFDTGWLECSKHVLRSL